MVDPRRQTTTALRSFKLVLHKLMFPPELTSNEESLEFQWFSLILREIERSRNILQLGEDWDGEGSPGYEADTWKRATTFLREAALALWVVHHIRLDTPSISPGPDGSIDIHWKSGERELLINIPANNTEPGTFYGDNKVGQIVKGALDISSDNLWLLMWLMQ